MLSTTESVKIGRKIKITKIKQQKSSVFHANFHIKFKCFAENRKVDSASVTP